MDFATRKHLFNLCDPEEALTPGDSRFVDLDGSGDPPPRGVRWADALATPIEASRRPIRQLVTAIPGTGLSTELSALAQRLGDPRGANLLVARADAARFVDLTRAIDVADLLLVVLGTTHDAVTQAGGSEPALVAGRIRYFLPEVAGVAPDESLSWPRALAELRHVVLFRERFRANVSAEFSRFVAEVRDELARLRDAARRAGRAGVLVVLDSLEKLSGLVDTRAAVLASAERVFGADAEYLDLPVSGRGERPLQRRRRDRGRRGDALSRRRGDVVRRGPRRARDAGRRRGDGRGSHGGVIRWPLPPLPVGPRPPSAPAPMAADPVDHLAPSNPGAGAARYRAALRCATLRREIGAGRHVLDGWSWLIPGIGIGALTSLFAIAGVGAEPAAPPPVDSIALPAPPFAAPHEWEPVFVVISKSMIFVGEEPTPVVLLPARDQLVQSGVDAKYKRAGPNDLFVVPLAQALDRARDARRREKGGDVAMEAILVADGSTPYRLLVEVLFTLGQSDVGKYHLMVRSGKK